MSELDDQNEGVRGGKGSDRSGGGFIEMRDSRVSNGIAWAMGILAVCIGSAILWVGSTLVGIRESLATLAATSSAQTAAVVAQLNRNDLRDESQEARLNNIDGRVYTLEGRNLRGATREQ